MIEGNMFEYGALICTLCMERFAIYRKALQDDVSVNVNVNKLSLKDGCFFGLNQHVSTILAAFYHLASGGTNDCCKKKKKQTLKITELQKQKVRHRHRPHSQKWTLPASSCPSQDAADRPKTL